MHNISIDSCERVKEGVNIVSRSVNDYPTRQSRPKNGHDFKGEIPVVTLNSRRKLV